MRNQTLRSYRLGEGDSLGWTDTEGGIVRITLGGRGESVELLVPTIRLRRLLIDAGWIAERPDGSMSASEFAAEVSGTLESEAVRMVVEALEKSETRVDELEESLGSIQRALGYPGDPVAEIEQRLADFMDLQRRREELLERNRELGSQNHTLSRDVLESRRLARRSVRRVGELEVRVAEIEAERLSLARALEELQEGEAR